MDTNNAAAAAAAAAPAQSVDTTAQEAFAANDAAKSKELHDERASGAPEVHGGRALCGLRVSAAGGKIKSIVFGGLDGIITTFAVISAIVGASLPLQVIILTGFATMIGDALSMGLGDCLSEAAEEAFIRDERKREAWEMANHPEGEIAEMVELYKQKGFTHEEAARIMELMTKSPKTHEYFIDHMLVQELGQMMPEDDLWGPAKNGAVTAASFIAFGSLPLFAYCIFYGAGWKDSRAMFGVCIALTALALFALGVLQSAIVRGSWIKQGMLTLANGGLAAAASYLVGWGLEQIVGNDACV